MMKMMMKVALFVVVVVAMASVDGAKILGFFPTDTHSHYLMYSKLMIELANRGHQVSVVTHFPMKTKIDNFEEIALNGSLVVPTMSIDEMLAMSDLDNEFDVIDICLQACDVVLRHPLIEETLRVRTFDLFITEIFGTDCFLAVGHKLNVPTIGIVSSVSLPWANDAVGNPDNPSYVPNYYVDLSQTMTFAERLYNTVMYVALRLCYAAYSVRPSQRIAEEVYGPLPSLREMARNYSMIFVNSHYSMNLVRPMVPQVVEIGGLHIPKTIGRPPEDLDRFLNASEHGVVYFSLGSFAPPETMSGEKLAAIIAAFGELKENVLWKVDESLIPKLPPNVKSSPWIPQLEVLCHPAVKLFIGHGGLLGMQEAVTCGVPMLGIPLFADQGHNLAQAREKGFARVLRYGEISKEALSRELNTMLTDDSYSSAARRMSSLFKDRPLHPMDTAVYWVEHVLRHGGTHHIRTPAMELAWYQHMLIDVVAALLAFALLALVLTFYATKAIVVATRAALFGVGGGGRPSGGVAVAAAANNNNISKAKKAKNE